MNFQRQRDQLAIGLADGSQVDQWSQQQNVMTATANDSAFLAGVSVNNNTHQNGKNKIIG